VKQDFYMGMPYVGAALFAFFVCASVFAVALIKAISAEKTALDPLQQLPLDDAGDHR
jgi:hypothetical protein